MKEYPKTNNLFERDDETKKLIVGAYRDEFVPQIKDWVVTEKVDGTNVRLLLNREPGGFAAEIRGRSDNANLPIGRGKTEKDLLREIWGWGYDRPVAEGEYVPLCNLLVSALDQIEPERTDTLYTMCVYGELIGPGIQKMGSSYGPRKTIRIFDVKTHRVTVEEGAERGYLQCADRYVVSSGYWRPWSDVVKVAEALGLPTAPLLRINGDPRWTVEEIVDYVYDGCYSRVAADNTDAGFTVPAEGVIARTDPYAFDSRGHRIMFKLKQKDLPYVDNPIVLPVPAAV